MLFISEPGVHAAPTRARPCEAGGEQLSGQLLSQWERRNDRRQQLVAAPSRWALIRLRQLSAAHLQNKQTPRPRKPRAPARTREGRYENEAAGWHEVKVAELRTHNSNMLTETGFLRHGGSQSSSSTVSSAF